MPELPTAGYSGTPLPKKLGLKPNCRLALLGAPDGFELALAPLPEGVTIAYGLASATTDLHDALHDVIVLFAKDYAALAAGFEPAARALQPTGGLWIAWPKRSSGVETDLREDRIRDLALATGLVDNKVCAVDAVWSGLRCVFRLKDRPPAKSPR